MSKRALSPVTIIFWCLVFLIIYGMALAPILGQAGQTAIINGGYTGIEKLFYDNLNLVVLVLFFIFIAAISVVSQN